MSINNALSTLSLCRMLVRHVVYVNYICSSHPAWIKGPFYNFSAEPVIVLSCIFHALTAASRNKIDRLP